MALLAQCISVARTSLFFGKHIATPMISTLVRHQSTEHAPPKRPLSGFIRFYIQQKSAIQSSQPGIKLMEMTRHAAVQWRNLSEEQRQEYLDESRRQHEVYKQRKSSYLDGLSADERTQEEQRRAEESRKRLQKRAARRHRMLMKELKKPIQGTKNGYMCFISAQMIDRGDAPICQFIKGLAEYWKQMSEEEKKPYEDQASANRLRYQQELVMWEQNMVAEGRPELIRVYRRAKTQKAEGKNGKNGKKGRKKAEVDEDTTWMREE